MHRLIILFLITFALSAQAETFVFVHGAHLTSSIWAPVQSRLQNAGYNVVTVDLPGRSQDEVTAENATLDLAVAKVCKVLSMQTSSVILVGHSQGGAVISHAVGQCSQYIKGLVYIAAVVPLAGTTAFEDLSKEDEEWFSKCATLDTAEKLWRVLPEAPLHEAFMADVSVEDANKYKTLFVDEPSLIADGIITYDSQIFNKIPKIYIETTNDRIITIASQRRIQSKQGFKKIYSLNSSHSPFFSTPKILAQMLIDSIGVVSNAQ